MMKLYYRFVLVIWLFPAIVLAWLWLPFPFRYRTERIAGAPFLLLDSWTGRVWRMDHGSWVDPDTRGYDATSTLLLSLAIIPAAAILVWICWKALCEVREQWRAISHWIDSGKWRADMREWWWLLFIVIFLGSLIVGAIFIPVPK